MSSENPSASNETSTETKKRRSTSIPFIVVMIIIGLVGWFRGKEIMTYLMYQQERWVQNSKVAKDKRYDEQMGAPTEGDYGWKSPDAPDLNADVKPDAEGASDDGNTQMTTAPDAETPE